MPAWQLRRPRRPRKGEWHPAPPGRAADWLDEGPTPASDLFWEVAVPGDAGRRPAVLQRREAARMIYAGVDIAKADNVIGDVDERGSELCRPMGFKNGAAGFERCEPGSRGWPRSRATCVFDSLCLAGLSAAIFRE